MFTATVTSLDPLPTAHPVRALAATAHAQGHLASERAGAPTASLAWLTKPPPEPPRPLRPTKLAAHGPAYARAMLIGL